MENLLLLGVPILKHITVFLFYRNCAVVTSDNVWVTKETVRGADDVCSAV